MDRRYYFGEAGDVDSTDSRFFEFDVVCTEVYRYGGPKRGWVVFEAEDSKRRWFCRVAAWEGSEVVDS